MRRVGLCIALLLCAAPASAQEAPAEGKADRPGATNPRGTQGNLELIARLRKQTGQNEITIYDLRGELGRLTAAASGGTPPPRQRRPSLTPSSPSGPMPWLSAQRAEITDLRNLLQKQTALIQRLRTRIAELRSHP